MRPILPGVDFSFPRPGGEPTYYVIRHITIYGNSHDIPKDSPQRIYIYIYMDSGSSSILVASGTVSGTCSMKSHSHWRIVGWTETRTESGNGATGDGKASIKEAWTKGGSGHVV